MKVLIVTDAWHPQVNGVVNTLERLCEGARAHGHAVDVLSPLEFLTLPCPSYPEIRLSLLPYRRVAQRIVACAPDALHIATEGPLGAAAKRWCVRHSRPFTTAYHTRFPEYVRARTGIPLALSYAWLRSFHGPASAMLVPTPRVREGLRRRGFTNTVQWSHGVDTQAFSPGERDRLTTARPIFLYVGRFAVEKNIEAFLGLDLPGSKWAVGSGPLGAQLARRHPRVHFAGIQSQAELARYFRAADVLVFPSRTDTFGLVMLEALACGTPVAAYPVPGPLDVIGESAAGVLDEDLGSACVRALGCSRQAAREHARRFSWDEPVSQFLRALAPWN